MWRGCGRRLQFLCTLWNSSCGWEPDSCLFQSSHRLCRIQIGAALAGACRPLDYLWSVGGGESCRIPVCCPPVSILGDRSGLVTVGSTRDSSLGGDVVCMRRTVGLFRGLGPARTSLMGRVVAIVSAVFALAHPPFGTILGAYTLVVLLSADAATNY